MVPVVDEVDLEVIQQNGHMATLHTENDFLAEAEHVYLKVSKW